jgi:hypothetical protein
MQLKVIAALVALPALAFADPVTLNRSSFTRTNQSAAAITATNLDKVIVGVATAGGTILVWNSTTTTSALLTDAVLVSSISLAAAGTFDFNNLQVKGIVYQTNTATNGVTILYKR